MKKTGALGVEKHLPGFDLYLEGYKQCLKDLEKNVVFNKNAKCQVEDSIMVLNRILLFMHYKNSEMKEVESMFNVSIEDLIKNIIKIEVI